MSFSQSVGVKNDIVVLGFQEEKNIVYDHLQKSWIFRLIFIFMIIWL